MSRSLPKVLSQSEQDDFLNQFNFRYQTPHRNYLMCRVMIDAGLRVSEVVSLKPEHLNVEDGELIVREGKGAKDRKVWINDELMNGIQEWIEDRRPESDYVFPTRDGGKIDTSYMRRMVKRIAEKAGVSEADKVSPHTLRHTFATDFYRETKDLRMLQKLLGHENISTTEIYTHIVDEDAKEAMRNFRETEKIA